jgi:hypothetical protein
MLHLYENGVEILRKKISNKSIETYWDNYNFIIWKKDIGGYSNTNGVFRNDNWGIASIIPVSKEGTWVLPPKYVKYFK